MKPTIISSANDEKLVEHIIQQNKDLQSSCESMKTEMNDLNNEKDMLENENESMQKSRQIMIGYMKNLNELSKTESKIRHNHYKSYCLMFQFNIGLLIFCSSFYAMLLAINNRTIQHVYYMVYLISLMVFTKYIYDTNKNIQKQNTDLYVELKKIESANDLINDLLDNL